MTEEFKMRRIILMILISSLFIGLFTSCGNRIVINEKLSGNSDHWAVTYEIKGRIYTRVDRNGNETLSSFGKYKATYEYIGDLSEIENLHQWGMNATPLFNFAKGRNCPPDEAPYAISKGGTYTNALLAFYNDEVPTITVTWDGDGDVGGEETINLH